MNHPDLGKIWIGGSQKKHLRRTPPARYIETETLKNTQFVMYCASQFPKVEIDEINITPHTSDLYWIDVAVKNDRVYPTSSDRAVQLKIAVKDKLSFNSSNNISLVEIPDKMTMIDPLNQDTQYKAVKEKTTEF